MRRAVARGRVFPQYYSTDRRYGRLSLKAIGLFPLMWANADDQGRLVGDPEEVKYAVCPNVDHITKQDIPELLKELEANELILCYNTPKSAAIQILDWWNVMRKLQWAWPSDYPPPEGWQDHLRYKKDAKTVITLNWPVSGENSGETGINAQVNKESSSGDNPGENPGETGINAQVNKESSSGDNPGENSGEKVENSPLTTPYLEKEKEMEKEEEEGEGNSPEDSAEEPFSTSNSGEKIPSPSLTADTSQILRELTQCFKREFGRVPASNPDKVIPREPNAREAAQLRDLAKNLSADGGVPLDFIKQAYREAAGQDKHHISYVRAVLLDWLGLARSPP